MDQTHADLLTGYYFFHNEDYPTFGVLRLDTDSGPYFVTVTRDSLLKLADACRKHANKLETTQ
jgi:hypothetical protein